MRSQCVMVARKKMQYEKMKRAIIQLTTRFKQKQRKTCYCLITRTYYPVLHIKRIYIAHLAINTIPVGNMENNDLDFTTDFTHIATPNTLPANGNSWHGCYLVK